MREEPASVARSTPIPRLRVESTETGEANVSAAHRRDTHSESEGRREEMCVAHRELLGGIPCTKHLAVV